MNMYYAVGGGLGHFSRAIAFIHSHPELSVSNTVVMVADRDMYSLANHHFRDKSWATLKIVKIPTEAFQNRDCLHHWLSRWLEKVQPKVAYLDTFPAGILGEWNGLSHRPGRIHYVGRYLKRGAYSHSTDICFDRAYQLEDWHPGQEENLRECSKAIVPFTLQYPEACIPVDLQRKISNWQQEGREVWAIVHSEPKDETEALLSYARDIAALEDTHPVYLQCSYQSSAPVSDVFPCHLFPAYGLFPSVDRLITACGFNLMRQTLAFRHQHLCMPFPRRYDDQFLRFKQWKAAVEK
mgnify:CR=1 FL=1|jgi:hypothetical protein